VKKCSNAELNLRSREVINSGYGTPEKFTETEKREGDISEIRIFFVYFNLFSLHVGVFD
jgi:hypothetical protein